MSVLNQVAKLCILLDVVILAATDKWPEWS